MSSQRYTPAQQQFYRNYINSPIWRARKTARIRKAGGQCEWIYQPMNGQPNHRCPRTRYLCVHHNNYDRLGAEEDVDLDVYCWFHHMLEHILWKRCSRCGGTVPVLAPDDLAENWLKVELFTRSIDLDVGPVNWKVLPAKKSLLDETPECCASCMHQLGY
jgi:hypothetical protein